MRIVVNAIIKDREGKTLVVDKNSPNGLITILPGGKLDGDESLEECLKRELSEELGVTKLEIKQKVIDVIGKSPTSGIETNVIGYETDLQEGTQLKTQAEVFNPRYMTKEEVLNLSTTTELTKLAINNLTI